MNVGILKFIANARVIKLGCSVFITLVIFAITSPVMKLVLICCKMYVVWLETEVCLVLKATNPLFSTLARWPG